MWFALGLVFSVGNLAYALLSSHFPPHLSGRVNTALNLGAFIGAFGLQWGFGALIDVLQANGLPPREAYRWTYGALVVTAGAGLRLVHARRRSHSGRAGLSAIGRSKLQRIDVEVPAQLARRLELVQGFVPAGQESLQGRPAG